MLHKSYSRKISQEFQKTKNKNMFSCCVLEGVSFIYMGNKKHIPAGNEIHLSAISSLAWNTVLPLHTEIKQQLLMKHSNE